MEWIHVKSIDDLPSGRILVSMKCNGGKPYVETAYMIRGITSGHLCQSFRIYNRWLNSVKQTVINSVGKEELWEVTACMKFPEAYEGE